VLDRDGVHYARMASHAHTVGAARVLSFGEHPMADLRLLGADLGPDGSAVRVQIDGRVVAFRLDAPGRHLVTNALAVLATAWALGIDPADGAAALAGWRPGAGRGARETLPWGAGPREGSLTLFDESYNASPTSVMAAIAVLGQVAVEPGGRRVLVLGDMRELGPTAPDLHAALAEPIAQAGVDRVYTAGPLSDHLHRRLGPEVGVRHAATSRDLISALLADLRAGDVVTVKGSLGSDMAPIVEALRAASASHAVAC
jgi:UDP-N-acetylmuramoyl-tripeptide--D-alanyl-D-alanine ligase